MTEENKKEGFIKVYRALWKNPISEKPNYLAVWLYLISHANFQDKHTIINGKKTLIKRGTFIGSILSISKHFHISYGLTVNILKYLETDNCIDTKRNSKFTLFSIKNYDKYNPIDNRIDNKMITKREQNDTTKNEKNEKNEKNNILQSSDCEIISTFDNNILPNLLSDKNKHIQIIGLYARATNANFENKEQQQSFIKRNLRASRELCGYSFERIVEVMKYLKDNADYKWTIETVGKHIDSDLLIINKQKDEDIIGSFFDKYKV